MSIQIRRNITILMDINELITSLTCPLTKKLFYNPVTTDDGNTYERAALEKYVRENNKSDSVDSKIGKTVFKNMIVKQLVDDFSLAHPDIPRYVPDNIDTDFEIVDNIYNKQFIKLIEYKKFNLDAIMNQTYYNINCVDVLFTYCSKNYNNVLVHIISNCENLEVCDVNSNKLLHYACKFENFGIIKLLFSKGVMVESPNNISQFPIHYACRYCSFEIVKFMVDNHCSLEFADDNGYIPLHTACEHNSIETVKYLIKHGSDINYYNCGGLTPIEVCNGSIKNKIMIYLTKKGIKPENQNDAAINNETDSDSD